MNAFGPNDLLLTKEEEIQALRLVDIVNTQLHAEGPRLSEYEFDDPLLADFTWRVKAEVAWRFKQAGWSFVDFDLQDRKVLCIKR